MIKREEEGDNLDNSEEVQYSKRGYSQYRTLALQWANSAKTKQGDIKVLFDPSTNTYNKLIADESADVGYRVLYKIKDTVANAESINALYKEAHDARHGEKQSIGEIIRQDIGGFRSQSRSHRNDLFDDHEEVTDGRSRDMDREQSNSDRSGDIEQGGRADGLNGDTQYSLRSSTDSEGRVLTPEQEKFFKDSKIRDAEGRLLALYHGTSAEFFTFDKSKIKIDNLGRGFYFVDSEKIAESYAERRTQERGGKERVVQSYINAVKPFDVDNVTREQAIEYLSYDYKATNKDASAEEARAFAEDIVSEEDGAETPDYGSSFSTHEANFQKWLREKGYDALIVSGVDKRTGMEGTAYVVFESNQIKLTSNENPTVNDDIRYSLRQTAVKHYTQEEVAQIINGIQANALQVREGNITIAGKKKLRDHLCANLNSIRALPSNDNDCGI